MWRSVVVWLLPFPYSDSCGELCKTSWVHDSMLKVRDSVLRWFVSFFLKENFRKGGEKIRHVGYHDRQMLHLGCSSNSNVHLSLNIRNVLPLLSTSALHRLAHILTNLSFVFGMITQRFIGWQLNMWAATICLKMIVIRRKLPHSWSDYCTLSTAYDYFYISWLILVSGGGMAATINQESQKF